MKFSDRVRALDLPLDQIVVIGSGLLDQLELRTAHDIDLAATPDLLARLGESPHWETIERDGERHYEQDGAEAWAGWGRELPYDSLRANAETIDGVSFCHPSVMIEKKIERGSEKDLADIAMLKEHYGIK